MNEKEKRMNINISEIVTAKLAQMDREGVIQRKIEETLEKTILGAITSELDSYAFRSEIGKQLRESVSTVAENCGLSAYNGFIAERVRDIVRDLYEADIAERIQKILSDVLLKKHEHVKLSDIFRVYREWVSDFVDSDDQRERKYYTAALDVRNDGSWKSVSCRFAEEPDREDSPDVEIRFMVWRDDAKARVSALYLDGKAARSMVRIGGLTEFEAFVANLYYNETEVELDIDEVNDNAMFDAAFDD